MVLSEQLFHERLSAERKRTERSLRPFLLMLLDVTGILATEHASKTLATMLSTLSASIRETDIYGWYRSNSVIGIVFSEIGVEQRGAIVSTMLTRVKGMLYGFLPFEEFNRISISYYLFPEHWDHDVPQRPSHPVLYPDISHRENGKRLFTITKRAIDVVGSVLGLLLAAPLFLLAALAVKLSSEGPVFFRQKRVGRHGTPFVFLKFRSMYASNDVDLHKEWFRRFVAGHEELHHANGKASGSYKLPHDPRVTKVGHFLRKTSLDELPQLINVLRGEMSLVGPRPPIPYEVDSYQTWHRRRVLEVKPGITGLWQVRGRSRVLFDDMVRLDLEYAQTVSLWLDLKILLQTPRVVVSGEGAY